MARRRPQATAEERDAAASASRSRWVALAACAWFAGFLAWFFSFPELPNNPPLSRADILRQTPWALLDLVDPPAEPHAQHAARPRSGWRNLPQRMDLLCVAAVLWIGAWSAGSLVLRSVLPGTLPAGSPSLTRLERCVLACGLGLSACGLLTLGLGLIGCLSRGLCVTLLSGCLAAELAIRWRERRVARLSVPAAEDCASCRAEWAAAIASAPFLLCMLLGACLPSTDFDVNEYHFEGPKEYFLNGQITFLPHNVYTSFPFGTEMLTLLAMVLRGDWYRGALAGKTALLGFAPLTALAVYSAGSRWFSRPAGALGAFVYLSTPWVYRISTIAYAEGALCFYLFAAAWAAARSIELIRGNPRAEPAGPHQDRAAPHRPLPGIVLRWLFLTGLFAGSAMACKYPAALSVVIPLAGAIGWAAGSHLPGSPPDRNRGARLLWSLVTFAAGTALTIGPWLAKNLVETGNPVYPLLYSIFGGRDWDPELDAKWRRAHSPHDHRPGDLAEKLVDVVAKSDWQSPLAFGLAPLVFLRARKQPIASWLAVYIGYLFLSWWVFTHRIDRFWVPLLPVAALLAGAGGMWRDDPPRESPGNAAARSTGGPLPSVWTCVLWLGLLVVSAYHLVFVMSGVCGYNAYLADLDDSRRFVRQLVTPDLALLNERLGPGSKVLSVGQAQVFDAEFPLAYNTVFDRNLFEHWCGETGPPGATPRLRPPAEIRRKLAAEKITHVLVNWREILRYRAPGSYGYPEFVSPEGFAALIDAAAIGPPWDIPSAWQEVDTLPADWQAEARRWGQRLIRTRADGSPQIATYQVFPILPEAPAGNSSSR